MGIILIPLYNLIDLLLKLYEGCIILSVILSWLISFGVINSYNSFVARIGQFLFQITEPLLYPLRQYLPTVAGIDLSPFVLILGIHLIRMILMRLVLYFIL